MSPIEPDCPPTLSFELFAARFPPFANRIEVVPNQESSPADVLELPEPT